MTTEIIDIIEEVAINPGLGLKFVENNRYNFDSEGNLSSGLVGELRYCAQPVRRALDIFDQNGIIYSGEGRSVIDLTLLNGFWTPIGLVDNARLRAEEVKKSGSASDYLSSVKLSMG